MHKHLQDFKAREFVIYMPTAPTPRCFRIFLLATFYQCSILKFHLPTPEATLSCPVNSINTYRGRRSIAPLILIPGHFTQRIETRCAWNRRLDRPQGKSRRFENRKISYLRWVLNLGSFSLQPSRCTEYPIQIVSIRR